MLIKLEKLEKAFYAVQEAAIKKIPIALSELDQRLAKALAQQLKKLEHEALPEIKAPKPVVHPVEVKRVAGDSGNKLGIPPGTEAPGPLGPEAKQDHNLHPEDVERSAKLMDEERLPCFKGNKLAPGMAGEMDRQLAGQQAGLNNMTVQEYLDGRAAYQANGRGDPAVAAQARKDYESDLTSRLTDSYIQDGIAPDVAEQQAQADAASQMKTLAALHNPDQVAGGPNVIDDFGDRTVNSTIGGQWASNVKGAGQSRVQMLDAAASAVPLAERSGTKMNVVLERCK